MSKKSPKIAALIADCGNDPRFDPHYAGYFKCFNLQLYYEAHDVLEELWLADRKAPDSPFYQGLIQVAGAFVHLQKHFLHPNHHVHGKRLPPASRLLNLALTNFELYPGHHLFLNLDKVRYLCRETIRSLDSSGFQENPWSPDHAPGINLET